MNHVNGFLTAVLILEKFDIIVGHIEKEQKARRRLRTCQILPDDSLAFLPLI